MIEGYIYILQISFSLCGPDWLESIYIYIYIYNKVALHIGVDILVKTYLLLICIYAHTDG